MPKFIQLTVLDHQTKQVKEKEVFNMAGISQLTPSPIALERNGYSDAAATLIRTFDDQLYLVKESIEEIFTSTDLRSWTVL